MKELCLVAVVDEGYQEYIPLFVYFALSAYPSYEILIYLDGTLHPQVADCLHAIRDMGRFEVRPLSYRWVSGDAQSFKSLRWLLYDEEFTRYEALYIGDIDVLITPEEPSLGARRVGHSRAIGLPYSNRVRPGTTKLVGIAHVVRTQEYFPPLLERMQRQRETIAAGTLRMHNEELLYRLMAESHGLPDPETSLATHHGIHLRAFHARRSLQEQRARTDYLFAKVFERHFEAFLAAARAETCADIVQRLRRIDYSTGAGRYAEAGRAVTSQFANVLSLCDDLLAERVGGR
jgi:hypothetical protein